MMRVIRFKRFVGALGALLSASLFISSASAADTVRRSALWTEASDQVVQTSAQADIDAEDADMIVPHKTQRASSAYEAAMKSPEGANCCGDSCCTIGSNSCCGNGGCCDGNCGNSCCGNGRCGGCNGCGNCCGSRGLFNGRFVGCNGKLFGLIGQSDRCFDKFISPISNPLFFEDPRTLTEARTIFATHWIDPANPVFGGGTAYYAAMQLRAAITERLSFIATKDGYAWIYPTNAPNRSGWANLALGLKYNIIRDPECQRIWSVGTTYQAPSGSTNIFQGQAGGEFHTFLTGGRQILDRGHFLTSTGYRYSATGQLSDMLYWSNHVDYEFLPKLYGVLEVNWFHWTRSGTILPVGFEGNDLFNLGSTGVAGNNIATMAVGSRKKFGSMHEAGIGYEFPLTQRRDILNDRLYVDLLLRY
jgi:hypothetical protein